jgi:hypothetical protein
MTLNVSLRVPDGIVIASDSLSTLNQPITQKVNVQAKCDQCGNLLEIKDVPAPAVSVPASTWPYTQKVFPFMGRFGLAIFGSNFVNNRSMYSHISDLTSKLGAEQNIDFTLDIVTDRISEYFVDQLKKEAIKTGFNVDLQPDNWWPFGFHLAGFTIDANNEPSAQSRTINIGKNAKVDRHEGIGCSWTGDGTVVNKIWKDSVPPSFNFFSLQDAIDYAKFLIRTTADYQRFSGSLPNVGGEIDIALVTARRGFQWISQKPLYKMLEKEET